MQAVKQQAATFMGQAGVDIEKVWRDVWEVKTR
jgi:hypothetical protein